LVLLPLTSLGLESLLPHFRQIPVSISCTQPNTGGFLPTWCTQPMYWWFLPHPETPLPVSGLFPCRRTKCESRLTCLSNMH
jgi:hypothetical protein